MRRWVQHISGQGEKWEVVTESPLTWGCYDRGIPIIIPKSEYVLSKPQPEVWEDVSERIEVLGPCIVGIRWNT